MNLIDKIRLWIVDKVVGNDLQVMYNVTINKGRVELHSKSSGMVKNNAVYV